MKGLCNPVWLFLGWILLEPSAYGKKVVEPIVSRMAEIENALNEWQFVRAEQKMQELLADHASVPQVLFLAGWVQFHLGNHEEAFLLTQKAKSELGDDIEKNVRYRFISAAHAATRDLEPETSANGQVVVLRRAGPDQILTPYLFETVQRTLKVVGEDLGYRLDHPVRIEVLPDASVLAGLTGLTEEAIETSGTIAVCKYGRILLTSPQATLRGYGWLDTVSHELTHMLISEKTYNRTPIWLHEALAKLQDTRWRSNEPGYQGGLSPMEESRLARALQGDKLVPFSKMHPSMALLPSREEADLAYSQVFFVARFLLQQKGYAGLQALLLELKKGQDDLIAIEKVFGIPAKRFESEWLRWLRRQKLVVLDNDDSLTPGRKRQTATKGQKKKIHRQKEVSVGDFYHLGELLRARGRVKAAVEEYKKALKQAGEKNASAWYLNSKLGFAYQELGRLEHAQKHFEASLRIHPDNLEAKFRLAQVFSQNKLTDQAWVHLVDCIRINPFDPRVHELAFRVAQELAHGKASAEFLVWQDFHKQALRLLARR